MSPFAFAAAATGLAAQTVAIEMVDQAAKRSPRRLSPAGSDVDLHAASGR